MSVIHVALQDGFDGDAVAVYFNGAEVFSGTEVRTRMQIGLAKSLEINAVPGDSELRVHVPARNADVKIPVKVSGQKDLYVGVSISPNGQLITKVHDEPFHYA